MRGRAPDDVLRRAEGAAARIFARAGVKVEWVDCRVEKCESLTGPWVQFVEQRRGASGYAVIVPGDSGYAVMRYPVIEDAASGMGEDPAWLLAATIAHELGHLMLGKGHARSGVMSPRFQRAEIEHASRGELLFTAEEGRRMRESR